MQALWTTREDGDQQRLGSPGADDSIVPDHLVLRRARQVHGSRVVVVDGPAKGRECEPWEPSDDGRYPDADALVATGRGFCLAVFTADCVPLVLASSQGVHAVVHAGWRGLLDGVVERTLGAMRALGATDVAAGIGPCIHPCCYAFGEDELDLLAARFGDRVRARTAAGQPALDLARSTTEAVASGGGEVVLCVDRCTACSGEYFSFRARNDDARQALLAWNAK